MNGLRSRMMAMQQAQSVATNNSTGRETDSKLPLRYKKSFLDSYEDISNPHKTMGLNPDGEIELHFNNKN
uniref:Uncharacterized protein n=1 Tax=Panagrolaimus superbus TaxID=310955 RepID=A0A914YQK5_9BILA